MVEKDLRHGHLQRLDYADTRSALCAAPRGPARTATDRSSRATRASPDHQDSHRQAAPRSVAATSAQRRRRRSTSRHTRGWGANFSRLGRRAAVFSARHARYVSRCPFQATSREIVEAALPSRAAIYRSESPAINPRESSSRSARDNRRGDRARARGIMPPVRAMNRWIDLVEHPTAAAALAKVSPPETRRWISTWSSWLSRLPWPARRRCIWPPPNP